MATKFLKLSGVMKVIDMEVKNLLDEENYFDQAEALHTVLSLYHEGQWSKKYELLCRSQFKPGRAWREDNVIKDNWFYNEIVEYNDAELEQLMNELEKFLDEKED